MVEHLLIVCISAEKAVSVIMKVVGRIMANLLNPGDVLGDVLNADWILDGQSMGLAFHTSFVDQDAAVGGQACIHRFSVYLWCTASPPEQVWC